VLGGVWHWLGSILFPPGVDPAAAGTGTGTAAESDEGERFAEGLGGAGAWPALLPGALVYAQRVALYVAAYTVEGQYLLQQGLPPGKEYAAFYARHPLLQRLSLLPFVALSVWALSRHIPAGFLAAGAGLALAGLLFYRLNGPGDKLYRRIADYPRELWRLATLQLAGLAGATSRFNQRAPQKRNVWEQH